MAMPSRGRTRADSSVFASDAMKCLWLLQDWTNGGAALPRASSRGQLEIWRDLFGPPPSLSPGRDALEFLEMTSALVNSLLNPESPMPGNNSYLLSQTLWIQARELQSGLAGFSPRKNSRAVERLAPLLYWLTRGTPEPGLKDQYSPLTAVTLQAGMSTLRGMYFSSRQKSKKRISLVQSVHLSSL